MKIEVALNFIIESALQAQKISQMILEARNQGFDDLTQAQSDQILADRQASFDALDKAIADARVARP